MEEYNNIPDEMKQLKNWLVWRLINKGGEKPSKVPFSVSGGSASVSDPNTWGSFKSAVAAYETGEYDGIGFVFTDTPFVGIDIDSCVNAETGEISAAASDIIETTQSYTELSQSGKGFHIILRGALPQGRRRRGSFEMYGSGSPRYFAMTGKVWEGRRQIAENQAAINRVHKNYIEPPKPDAPKSTGVELMPDEEVIARATTNAKTGGAFLALYDGNWQGKYNSQSEADQALCNYLAFWTGCNAEQMDRLFRSGGLMRPKWDELHGSVTYGERTLQRACVDCREVYSPDYKKQELKCSVTRLSTDLVSMDDVEEIEIEWLVKEYIPKGQITLLAGDGGSGKTSVVCQIVASVSSGKSCFMLEDTIFTNIERQEPQTVLFFSAEDSMQHVLKKRLRLNGAVMENIKSIDPSDDRFERLKFDDPFLGELIKEHRPALVIFDPIQSFIPWKADLSKRNQVRQSLTNLIKYGEKYGCTFLIIVHTNKQSNVWGRKRIADTADLWDAARSVLIAGETGEDNIRYISHEKCNYGPTGETVLFSIEGGAVKFNGYSGKKDREYVNARFTIQRDIKREAAKDFILGYLENGAVKVKDLDVAAKAAGYSDTGIKRAKAELKSEGLVKIFHKGLQTPWSIERLS